MSEWCVGCARYIFCPPLVNSVTRQLINSMKVAFLGLGAIGAPMARHLAPHYDLFVWNRTASRAGAFARDNKATATSTPAEAVRDAAVVITCLPTSREVESLLDGPDGMFDALASGSTLIDCTSGDPATSRRIAARIAERSVGFVDAPVSGGVSGATKGILTIMCGGDVTARSGRDGRRSACVPGEYAERQRHPVRVCALVVQFLVIEQGA